MALDGKVCYFTFGRFQPPTTGHKENFDGVKRAAGNNDYRIYISQTVDTKGTNPLLPNRKLFYMNKMFPTHRGKIYSGPKQPVAAMQDLMLAGYDEVVFLVGSDRGSAMQFLHKYNGKDFANAAKASEDICPAKNVSTILKRVWNKLPVLAGIAIFLRR